VLRSIKDLNDLIPHLENIERLCLSMKKVPDPYVANFVMKWMDFCEEEKRKEEGTTTQILNKQ
jgi:hypothetical protein